MATYVVFKDMNREFRWHLRSDKNNKIIADSGEGYKNKADLLTAIEWMRNNAKEADIDDQT